MVTTATAVTSTMQNVENVKYNTTTDQTHLKQTTVVVGVRVNKKRVTIVVTSCPKPFTGMRNTVLGKSTRVGADYRYVTVN